MIEPLANDIGTTKRRFLAISLAECPGWTDWALPLLAGALNTLETEVLTSPLPTDELLKKRAAFQELNKFLSKLHSEAKGAFEAGTPSLVHTDVESHLPDPGMVDKILYSFQYRNFQAPAPADQSPKPPDATPPIFSPFAGVPVPPSRPK